ncbi:uncharacterized protein LY79DRAFT_541813 [Colletotrichum navitas]|uniref:Uncharacterized protein n=1 Tax=Colletotrichum navitas TaxID=681940 RepID=A0AAD8Q828_9PEZI|nr:uncharacterized protein LY79DRAFT_541813 [Colletotrichum navitas]KAK1597490.1 hypothetical protein LY79DRAFT_541813 [Colletotrichum navitas]
MKVPFILSLALIVAQVQATCYECSCWKRNAQRRTVIDHSDTRATCRARGGRMGPGYCIVDIAGSWHGNGWLNLCNWSGDCDQTSENLCN